MLQREKKCAPLPVILISPGIFCIFFYVVMNLVMNEVRYWRNTSAKSYAVHRVSIGSSTKPKIWVHSHREQELTSRKIPIVGWNELPKLKDDGYGPIPLTKEIYKVLRKSRWETEPISKIVDSHVWIKTTMWGEPSKLIEIQCPRNGIMFNMKISKSISDLENITVDAIVHHVRAAPNNISLDERCSGRSRRPTKEAACVMWTREPPTWDSCLWNRGLEPTDEESYMKNFDFGLTYKLDHQHILVPNKGFVQWDRVFQPLPKEFLESKQHLIGFLQNNCGEAGDAGRQFLVKGIMDALAPNDTLISFGKCLRNTNETLEHGFDLERSVVSRFWFWIALENSVCDGYISEKFLRPMWAGSIPIVFETSGIPGYSVLWPEHSYINAADYADVEALVKDIKLIAQDQDRYLSYFAWRKNAKVVYESKIRYIDKLLQAGMDFGTEEGCKHRGGPSDALWGTRTQQQFEGSWCTLAEKIYKLRETDPDGYYDVLPPMTSCIPKAMASLVDVERICNLTEKGKNFVTENFC